MKPAAYGALYTLVSMLALLIFNCPSASADDSPRSHVSNPVDLRKLPDTPNPDSDCANAKAFLQSQKNWSDDNFKGMTCEQIKAAARGGGWEDASQVKLDTFIDEQRQTAAAAAAAQSAAQARLNAVNKAKQEKFDADQKAYWQQQKDNLSAQQQAQNAKQQDAFYDKKKHEITDESAANAIKQQIPSIQNAISQIQSQGLGPTSRDDLATQADAIDQMRAGYDTAQRKAIEDGDTQTALALGHLSSALGDLADEYRSRANGKATPQDVLQSAKAVQDEVDKGNNPIARMPSVQGIGDATDHTEPSSPPDWQIRAQQLKAQRDADAAQKLATQASQEFERQQEMQRIPNATIQSGTDTPKGATRGYDR